MFRLARTTRLLTPIHTRLSSSFSRPGPPKLPSAEQAEFERLQKEASVSSAFQPVDGASDTTTSTTTNEDSGIESGALFKGAKPEFEGDTNPRTGEVGGPKNEPLRWGGESDWSYNGKVTDF
ncbi:hypothetical protein VHEMI00863 [[Torrubiella] hemipterigena]|uniref:Succinate dehydrogenase assembly factor 4, mitochondrial n=1 Tax=[Torrubiella] hemipterigena TaxID=1531966 RepID=A0A0A1T370_9HYPO|nr:hypothetical protein VHEMI00863 [[Torrubiella] hemipterigena]